MSNGNHLENVELGRLFQRAAREFSDTILKRMADKGYTGLSLFHTALVAHLDENGTRVVDLARRAGMTKQAMGQIANDLEEAGYVVRKPDPDDRRASLVCFTDVGRKLLEDSYIAKREADAIYEQRLGEKDFAVLKRLMLRAMNSES